MTPKEAVGDYEPRDWSLDPKSHAARLHPEAGALRRLLESSVLDAIMDRYLRASRNAAAHQDRYKKLGTGEIVCTTAAAIVGAFVLFVGGGEEAAIDAGWSSLRVGLLVIQAALVAAAVSQKFILTNAKEYVRWQQERSRAETARIELFETACGLREDIPKKPAGEGELPLLGLQLEYFLRYQLQVQLNYYDQRGAQHRDAARKWVSRAAILTFGASLAAALAGMGAQLGDWVDVAAVAALVAPLVLSGQTNLSRLHQDERNAERYKMTLDALERKAGKRDEVRRAAARGDAAAVHAFIRDVNEVISVEHSQWLTEHRGAVESQP